MARLGSTLLKGLGVLVVIVIALSVIATILSVLVGIVSTILSLLVTLAFFALLLGGAYGLFRLLYGGTKEKTTDGSLGRTVTTPEDPVDRLHSRYVNGDISEAEFERQLELQLGSDDLEDRLDGGDRSADRTRLRDRL